MRATNGHYVGCAYDLDVTYADPQPECCCAAVDAAIEDAEQHPAPSWITNTPGPQGQ